VRQLILFACVAPYLTGTVLGAATPAARQFSTYYLAAQTTELALYTSPDGSAGDAIAVTPQGTVAVVGYPNSLLIARSASGPSVLGIAGSPAFHVSQTVAPRELISIYGLGIGPPGSQSAQITNGVIGNSLGGVQVLFDGKPAALLYGGPTQINAIVPASVVGRQSTAIQIVAPSGTVDGPTLQVQPALPQVFADVTGRATAVNQDGTLNSAANPAPSGTIVSVWITGGGAISGGAPDNRINTVLNDSPFPMSVLSSASSQAGGQQSLEVLYGGDAPLLPSGVSQVNFRTPPAGFGGAGTLEFQIQAGTAVSEVFYVYVK
jgi:uncharacterized protein (TIGR03437 family)